MLLKLQMSTLAYSDFFKNSNGTEDFDSSAGVVDGIAYDVGSGHTGAIAKLIRYLNVARVASKQNSKKTQVRILSGEVMFEDIVEEHAYLMRAAWATLKAKLNPHHSKIGLLPLKLEKFVNIVQETLEEDLSDNILASIASYIAIYARLSHRFQATTVVEPQWNVEMLNREANRCVGQVMFYLQ